MARLGTWTLVLTLLVFVFVLGTLNDTAVTAEEFFLVPLVLVATMTSATGSRGIPSAGCSSACPLCVVLGVMGEDYPIYAIRTNPGSLPAPEWVSWMSGFTFGVPRRTRG